MSVKNFYPEKPVMPFRSYKIEMSVIIAAIRAVNYPLEVKRTAYVLIRNESANGKSVINGTNFCGAQSDSGRWPSKFDNMIQGTCNRKENGNTNRVRGFLVFTSVEAGVDFVCDRVQSKGIFIGEKTVGRFHKGEVKTPEQLADAYQDEWVRGADVTPTTLEMKNFVSMYKQACELFK